MLHPVHLVLGDDEFLAERARKEIITQALAPVAGTPPEVITLNASDVTEGEIAHATSPSLFGEDRVVVVDGVKYDAEKGVWNGGRVYDPTKGKSYKVEVSFEDDRTLRVKGSLLGFSRSVYWQKIE